MFNVQNIINDMCFEDEDFEQLAKEYDCSDPACIEIIINKCKEKEIACGQLEIIFSEHKSKEKKISDAEIKQVFLKLKNREADPNGTFDKAGRFYLKDYELVNVRSPSAAYPYSQMHAGRTAKFVKALAEKYKCDSLEELEAVAYGRKRYSSDK